MMGRTDAARSVSAWMALCGLLALAGCDAPSGRAEGYQGFQKKYVVARGALEDGDYARANRQFARLMDDAGPFRARIQLEYAHSLLRAGQFTEAAQMAEAMASAESGAASAAALAVAGTAHHEMGLAALAAGEQQAGRAHLQQAQGQLAQVLKGHPDLDPLGALAGRQASIAVRLAKL